MAENLNVVALTGNLTKDPELRQTPSGTAVCNLRLAVNGSRKQGDQWIEEPNYFDVTVWGKQGENVAAYMTKGRSVAVQGRLKWREYTDKDGNNRQAVDVVADRVQFLGDGKGRQEQSDLPADTSGFDRGVVSSDPSVPF